MSSPVISQSAPAQPAARLYFVDHLRVALTILVVLHHLSVIYGANTAFYYVEPPSKTDVVGYLTLLCFELLNQGYFMGFFFLLSGYLTPAKKIFKFWGNKVHRPGSQPGSSTRRELSALKTKKTIRAERQLDHIVCRSCPPAFKSSFASPWRCAASNPSIYSSSAWPPFWASRCASLMPTW